MSDYVFGSYILEILTAGMYQDSRIIFREYIQNACDAIDAAVSLGIMSSRTEGEIRIEIDSDGRNITIEDNGTGIREEEFVRVMGSIADSEKRQSENKGFRGIGKLCGLAYCSSAVFSAKSRGEGVISRLESDAKVMRELIGEDADNEYKAAEILNLINDFGREETEDIEGHFFRVELRGINEENTDLLDFERVREYLSFAAPLPYDNGFAPYGKMIHEHAEKLGRRIDEYNIFLNGEQLFKGYTREFETSLCVDEVFGLEFHDFTDDNDNLIAWMWFGVSCFRGAIKKGTVMRGIRLRKKNTQIGNEYTLQKLFEEDRGITYFIGELFCVSEDLLLTPHSEYFIENPARNEFEAQIREYFIELKRIYYDSSRVNNLFKEVDGTESGMKALAKINKLRDKGGVMRRVIGHIEAERTHEDTIQNIPHRRKSHKAHTESAKAHQESAMLRKIFDIIEANTDQDTAEKLITQIRSNL
ncbi:MAG: ATP-binding protein [Synergistaceae bacterium]|nr:ATP-binding protein [Synergistaceae bacterium]